jgi:hypothetical protein
VEIGVENLIRALHFAYAAVDASEVILSAQIREPRKLVLYFRLGELSMDVVVYDREPLFFRVRGSGMPRDVLE